MDLITGKDLKAFKAYIKKENGWTSQDFNEHYKCQGNDKYTCADIIEWLDSVGIYVIPRKLKCDVYPCSFNINDSIYLGIVNKFETRQQATQEAIKKAVEIYNKGAN